MNNQEAKSLGQRALAAGFTWVDGAACLCCIGRHSKVSPKWINPPCIPDLRDAATDGILAAQVREAYRDEHMAVEWCAYDEVWNMRHGSTHASFLSAPTRVHAWVAVLEALVAGFQVLESGNGEA